MPGRRGRRRASSAGAIPSIPVTTITTVQKLPIPVGGRVIALVAQYGPSMRRLAIFGLSAVVLVVLPAGGAGAATPTTTFAAAGRQALETLLHTWYGGNGTWRECDQAGCPEATGDWGVDSLTYALYLRWETAADSSIPPVMSALTAAASELSGPLPASLHAAAGATCRSGTRSLPFASTR